MANLHATCKYCKARKLKTELIKVNLVYFCDYEHATAQGRAKAKVTREKASRKQLKADKERIKTKSDWLKDAQVVFNAFIRGRDKDCVCISCQKPPKKKNAGHYRSVGAAPELRFEELNVHLQCEHCNTFLSSNAIEYRINLVKKIGLDKVEWLEGPHEPLRPTIEDAKEIIKTYRAKLKAIN